MMTEQGGQTQILPAPGPDGDAAGRHLPEQSLRRPTPLPKAQKIVSRLFCNQEKRKKKHKAAVII
jgi:hypothetical protein